jgi:glycosyltransferase involved in cell wall biosynthesis
MTKSLAPRVARRLRDELGRIGRAARDRRRHREMLRTPQADDGPCVFYGYDRMPGRDELAFGGMVKFQLLSESSPNTPRGFDVLYLGSSSLPADAAALVGIARRRGASFVWNQNGVAYPGWYGPGYEKLNRSRARLFHAADHVVFQSAFCKLSADRYYGERREAWEILHNPVEIERFTPAETRPPRPLTLLLGGNQYQRYRFEAALDALAALPDTHLLVSGSLSWAREAEREGRALVEARGLDSHVELLGPYTQSVAPELLRRADILLHTKYNDPCPTIVLEAMACGLPVVYSASGGVPELVGEDAGVGIPAPLDWDQDHPPAPGALAAAVLELAERLEERAEAARRRAVERYDARRWIARHRELFEELRGR